MLLLISDDVHAKWAATFNRSIVLLNAIKVSIDSDV